MGRGGEGGGEESGEESGEGRGGEWGGGGEGGGEERGEGRRVGRGRGGEGGGEESGEGEERGGGRRGEGRERRGRERRGGGEAEGGREGKEVLREEGTEKRAILLDSPEIPCSTLTSKMTSSSPPSPLGSVRFLATTPLDMGWTRELVPTFPFMDEESSRSIWKAWRKVKEGGRV